MNDDELHRQVERLAQHFESQGFVVTRQLEVEAAGFAALQGVKAKTLNSWRDRAHGPPASRTVRRVAWYSIAEIARWMEQQAQRAHVDCGGPP